MKPTKGRFQFYSFLIEKITLWFPEIVSQSHCNVIQCQSPDILLTQHQVSPLTLCKNPSVNKGTKVVPVQVVENIRLIWLQVHLRCREKLV